MVPAVITRPKLAYAVGSSWKHQYDDAIFANAVDPGEAIELWNKRWNPHMGEDLVVMRVPQWDGRTSLPTGREWLDAGFNYWCDGPGYPCTGTATEFGVVNLDCVDCFPSIPYELHTHCIDLRHCMVNWIVPRKIDSERREHRPWIRS